MTEPLPVPGYGYVIRERLGGGNWKSAYRATSAYSLADVALLYFHDESKRDVVAKDVLNLIRTVSKHRFSGYLAEFLGVQKGEDGRIFIIEELLDRPLQNLAPIFDILQFTRVARDLSRGLLCLHDNKLIHRDLKLDNCGLDHQQLAKIFDLGSVTSDVGSVRGSVLTRAPELFSAKDGKDEPQCDYATDVWALGATLFALRTGEYPFVHRREVDERNAINEEWKKGRITTEAAQSKKEVFDRIVADRILEVGAEEELKRRIHASLRGRAEEILLSMLSFDRSKRRQIQECETAFSNLANELAGAGAVEKKPSPAKWDTIRDQLHAVEKREFILTVKQIERIVAEYKRDKPEDANREIEATLKKIKEQLVEA